MYVLTRYDWIPIGSGSKDSKQPGDRSGLSLASQVTDLMTVRQAVH